MSAVLCNRRTACHHKHKYSRLPGKKKGTVTLWTRVISLCLCQPHSSSNGLDGHDYTSGRYNTRGRRQCHWQKHQQFSKMNRKNINILRLLWQNMNIIKVSVNPTPANNAKTQETRCSLQSTLRDCSGSNVLQTWKHTSSSHVGEQLISTLEKTNK